MFQNLLTSMYTPAAGFPITTLTKMAPHNDPEAFLVLFEQGKEAGARGRLTAAPDQVRAAHCSATPHRQQAEVCQSKASHLATCWLHSCATPATLLHANPRRDWPAVQIQPTAVPSGGGQRQKTDAERTNMVALEQLMT